MNTYRLIFRSCLILLIGWLLIGTIMNILPTHAQSSDASALIQAVNALRVSNGLPPYQVNSALMAAAQAHSQYQVEIGSITHTGRGGSSAKGRALAAGYGAGATVYVSENVAGGTSLTPQSVVQIWQGDSLHLNTMLGASYTDVGAGVATDGNMVYYTLDVGYIAGQAGSGSQTNPSTGSGSAGSGSSNASGTTVNSAELITSVKVATPAADGSITHVVEAGQVLLNIATAYGVKFQDMLSLNGLTPESIIYPGDRILIKPADPTPTFTATATATALAPTATQIITATPLAFSVPMQVDAPMDDFIANSSGSSQVVSTSLDPLLLIIGSIFFLGIFLIIVGSLLKRNPQS